MAESNDKQRTIYSYTIYHSANTYIGTVLLRRALAETSNVKLVRRPIYIPKKDGILVADLLGGRENRNAGPYNREDCTRWARKYNIPFHYPTADTFLQRVEKWKNSPFAREELATRAFYAADEADAERFDAALFEAAWVKGLDVNSPDTIASAALQAGIDPGTLLEKFTTAKVWLKAQSALREFHALGCPGVPTVTVGEQRFFGKDRIDWILEACMAQTST